MNRFSRLLPSPALSGALCIAWLWLNETLAPGHFVLGLLLGLAIPLLTRHFWQERGSLPRPDLIVAYMAIVLLDILIANVQVARLVLGPKSRLKSGFARVPLELKTNHAITVLASTISLTPGTVSVDLTLDRRALVVHYLSSEDPQALVRTIKQRYERRVMRIFEC